ncbi:histidine acid phosphatase [Achlya hypogyna]|uniref:Histidine acid phosphatase n=1 Tax=Achlya hypogyna TaxID=1202772 RepID=A0A1V9YC29_ACHHY|nr:histidine acid phosphatase [Achlya hypogyna]
MPSTDLELRHVVVAFRHGDRSPILPKLGKAIDMDAAERDFWGARLATPEQIAVLDATAKRAGLRKNEPAPTLAPLIGGAWPNGFLTARGVEQMISKGRDLRVRYGSFLQTPSVDDVYVRSTNVVRTIQSGQSVLHGMFPEFVKAVGETPDVEIHLHPTCPLSLGHHMDYHHLSTILKARRHESPVQDIDALEAQVHALVGLDEGEDVQWSFLREILVCRVAHDFPFPPGMSLDVVQQSILHNAWEWHARLSDKAFLAKAFGRGVHEAFGYLSAATQGASEHKLTILSAHDDTLCGLIYAFQLHRPGARFLTPEYGSVLTFELYQSASSGAWFLKANFDGADVYFQGHDDTLCPFAHVQALVQTFPSQ